MSIEPPHSPLSDRVGRPEPRDDEARANELESFRPKGIGVAMDMLHVIHEAEDVADQMIAKLFINGFPYGVNHEAWFVSCIKHAVIDRMRSADWCKTQNDAILAKRQAKVETPEDHALANEREETIQWGLSHLSSDDQEILRLRFVNGMTIEEVAHHFHRPPDTLYSWQRRAVKRLVQILKKGGKINV